MNLIVEKWTILNTFTRPAASMDLWNSKEGKAWAAPQAAVVQDATLCEVCCSAKRKVCVTTSSGACFSLTDSQVNTSRLNEDVYVLDLI